MEMPAPDPAILARKAQIVRRLQAVLAPDAVIHDPAALANGCPAGQVDENGLCTRVQAGENAFICPPEAKLVNGQCISCAPNQVVYNGLCYSDRLLRHKEPNAQFGLRGRNWRQTVVASHTRSA